MAEALTFAYADPPYVGQSKRHYRDHPDFAGEVDHAALIPTLDTYDCWALSASVPSLRQLLPLCPDDVRILTWVKPFAAYKRNIRVAYAWEPVIVRMPPRRDGSHVGRDFGVDEVVSESITMGRGLSGAKPERFCWWLFSVMGLCAGDRLVDLYPGSGAVTAAWDSWQAAGCPRLKQQIKTTNHVEEARDAA